MPAEAQADREAWSCSESTGFMQAINEEVFFPVPVIKEKTA
jgi:hypothetical protein